MKEKILNIFFHHRILGGQIYLNIFLPPKYGVEIFFLNIFSFTLGPSYRSKPNIDS